LIWLPPRLIVERRTGNRKRVARFVQVFPSTGRNLPPKLC